MARYCLIILFLGSSGALRAQPDSVPVTKTEMKQMMFRSRDAISTNNAIRVDILRLSTNKQLSIEYDRKIVNGFNLVAGWRRQVDTFTLLGVTKPSGYLRMYNGWELGFYISRGRPALGSSHGVFGYRHIQYKKEMLRVVVENKGTGTKSYALLPATISHEVFDFFYRMRWRNLVLDPGLSIILRKGRIDYKVIGTKYVVANQGPDTYLQCNLKFGYVF